MRFLHSLLRLLVAAILLAPAVASGQVAPRDTSAEAEGTSFFGPKDVTIIVAATFLSIGVGHYDTKIAQYMRSSSVQGSDSTLVKTLTKANETTLTLAALLSYGIGRAVHSSTLTDVSAHVGESLLLTNVVSQAIRGPFGRARPYVTHDENNSVFHVRKGFTSYDYRSLPSLHSASAFAAASALTEEMRERDFGGTWIVAPVLYGAACIPGLTRMYLDQHWASDVVMGAFVGAFLGQKVVHHAHTNPRNRFSA